jgi:hypothetical protein
MPELPMDSEFTLRTPDQPPFDLLFPDGMYLLSVEALDALRHIAIVRVGQITPFQW